MEGQAGQGVRAVGGAAYPPPTRKWAGDLLLEFLCK